MIVDGKLVAEGLKERIKKNLLFKKKKVCFVIFGDDPGSRQFIKMKRRFAESLGIETVVEEHPENLIHEDVKMIIEKIISQGFSGIVIQLPLPNNLNTEDILNLVPPELDVDVLSSKAKELFINGGINKIPPVSRSVLEILNYYKVDLKNKKILIIGTGRLVGEPVSKTFLLKGINFDQINITTSNEIKNKLIKNADIIISGAGDPHFIKPEMIKDEVVLIDAGTSESEGRIVGDVDPSCFDKASLVTPVPGGVGPVTLASLFLNL